MVETLTKVVTKSITNTKLALATLAAFIAGGSAFIISPVIFGPDLIVSEINFDNTTRTAKVVIKNIGRVSSAKTEVSYTWPSKLLSRPKMISISAIGSGGTTSFSLNYPSGVPTNLIVTADPANKVKELNEKNNTLNKNVPSFCTDSDKGTDIYTKGVTRGCQFEDCAKISEHVDKCVYTASTSEGMVTFPTTTSNYLTEGSCSGNQLVVPLIECEYGCFDGACKPKPKVTCTDSDWPIIKITSSSNWGQGFESAALAEQILGNSIYTKGSVTIDNGISGPQTNGDQCYGNKLMEATCWDYEGETMYQDVPVKCNCLYDACVKTPTSSISLKVEAACESNIGCSANGFKIPTSNQSNVGEFYFVNTSENDNILVKIKSITFKLVGSFIGYNVGDNTTQVKIIMEEPVSGTSYNGTIDNLDAGTSKTLTVNFDNGFNFSGTQSQLFKFEINTIDSDFLFTTSTSYASSTDYLMVNVTGLTWENPITGEVHNQPVNATDDKRVFHP